MSITYFVSVVNIPLNKVYIYKQILKLHTFRKLDAHAKLACFKKRLQDGWQRRSMRRPPHNFDVIAVLNHGPLVSAHTRYHLRRACKLGPIMLQACLLSQHDLHIYIRQHMSSSVSTVSEYISWIFIKLTHSYNSNLIPHEELTHSMLTYYHMKPSLTSLINVIHSFMECHHWDHTRYSPKQCLHWDHTWHWTHCPIIHGPSICFVISIMSNLVTSCDLTQSIVLSLSIIDQTPAVLSLSGMFHCIYQVYFTIINWIVSPH